MQLHGATHDHPPMHVHACLCECALERMCLIMPVHGMTLAGSSPQPTQSKSSRRPAFLPPLPPLPPLPTSSCFCRVGEAGRQSVQGRRWLNRGPRVPSRTGGSRQVGGCRWVHFVERGWGGVHLCAQEHTLPCRAVHPLPSLLPLLPPSPLAPPVSGVAAHSDGTPASNKRPRTASSGSKDGSSHRAGGGERGVGIGKEDVCTCKLQVRASVVSPLSEACSCAHAVAFRAHFVSFYVFWVHTKYLAHMHAPTHETRALPAASEAYLPRTARRKPRPQQTPQEGAEAARIRAKVCACACVLVCACGCDG